jgi:probable rRNA maturation factor
LANIVFISKIPEFQLNNASKLKNWLNFVCKKEKVDLEQLIYFFVNENEIIDINSRFLNHNYKTDIITFTNNFVSSVNGEIFICINVIKENCIVFSNGSFEDELHRVIVHGLLHLIGYKDASTEDIRMMRERENYYLEILRQI